MREQKSEVDLPRARLVTIGHICDLDMADAAEQALQRTREVAFHDLHVEDIVLQPCVGLARGVEDIDGLGAGFANVPALNLLMSAPLKVAVGSSGLLISVINSSAAWVYFERGALLPLIVVPAILGVMLGSRLGARLLGSTPAPVVRRLVIVVMLLAGLRALSRGLGVWA